MIKQTLLLSAMLIGPWALFAQTPADPALRVQQLRRELLAFSEGSANCATDERHSRSCINEAEGLVRAMVLGELNGAADPERLPAKLRPMLLGNGDESVSVLRSRTTAGDLVVVGYSIPTKVGGSPGETAVLDGFRSNGAAFEAASPAGFEMSNSVMHTQKLASPRAGEMWIFAHGRQIDQTDYRPEKMRIYSFDGQQFTELWAAPPKRTPKFEITGSALQILYFDPELASSMKLTLALTTFGPLEADLIPIQQ